MAHVYKPVGGALLGVTIPIVTEYAVKGARAGATVAEPTKGLKWSGILGLGEGAIGILGAVGAEQGWWLKGMKDEDKALLASFGGAGLATGLSVLILDELRKRTLYAFKRKGVPSRVPLAPEEEGLEEVPPEELIKEI